MTTPITLETLLDALTLHRPRSCTCDEMGHTGGVGISFIERWTVRNDTTVKGPWVWRVMWIPRRVRGPSWKQHTPKRIAYGVANSREDARLQGTTVHLQEWQKPWHDGVPSGKWTGPGWYIFGLQTEEPSHGPHESRLAGLTVLANFNQDEIDEIADTTGVFL